MRFASTVLLALSSLAIAQDVVTEVGEPEASPGVPGDQPPPENTEEDVSPTQDEGGAGQPEETSVETSVILDTTSVATESPAETDTTDTEGGAGGGGAGGAVPTDSEGNISSEWLASEESSLSEFTSTATDESAISEATESFASVTSEAGSGGDDDDDDNPAPRATAAVAAGALFGGAAVLANL